MKSASLSGEVEDRGTSLLKGGQVARFVDPTRRWDLCSPFQSPGLQVPPVPTSTETTARWHAKWPAAAAAMTKGTPRRAQVVLMRFGLDPVGTRQCTLGTKKWRADSISTLGTWYS